MILLLLGSTSFLGPAIVESAPLAQTARDIAQWMEKTCPDFDFGLKPGAPGITRAREAELIAAWKAHTKI